MKKQRLARQPCGGSNAMAEFFVRFSHGWAGGGGRQLSADGETTLARPCAFFNRITKPNAADFLVVGADGNPCWAFACYGRKVEMAIDYRKQGCKLLIVHENDFWDAARD